MKIINRISLIILMSFCLTFCSGSQTPEDTVDQFYKFMNIGDFKSAYQLVSKFDKDYKSLKEFEGPDDLSKNTKKHFWSLVSYQIKKAEITGERASVPITINMPDVGSKLGKKIGEGLSSPGVFENEYEAIKEIRNGVLKDLELNNLGFIKINNEIEILLENGKWKIFFNWANEAVVRNGIIKAIELGKNNKIDEAIIELKKVLEHDKDNQIAKEYIIILKKEKKKTRGHRGTGGRP